ncbi:hypothetical protein Tco_0351205 [Tanacetum coccineum]
MVSDAIVSDFGSIRVEDAFRGLLLLVSYRVIAWYKHENGFHDPIGSKGGTKKDRNTKKSRSKVVRKSNDDLVGANDEDTISMAEKIHDMERQMLDVWEFATRMIIPLEVPPSMELGQRNPQRSAVAIPTVSDIYEGRLATKGAARRLTLPFCLLVGNVLSVMEASILGG